jgi:hypothetical protein
MLSTQSRQWLMFALLACAARWVALSSRIERRICIGRLLGPMRGRLWGGGGGGGSLCVEGRRRRLSTTTTSSSRTAASWKTQRQRREPGARSPTTRRSRRSGRGWRWCPHGTAGMRVNLRRQPDRPTRLRHHGGQRLLSQRRRRAARGAAPRLAVQPALRAIWVDPREPSNTGGRRGHSGTFFGPNRRARHLFRTTDRRARHLAQWSRSRECGTTRRGGTSAARPGDSRNRWEKKGMPRSGRMRPLSVAGLPRAAGRVPAAGIWDVRGTAVQDLGGGGRARGGFPKGRSGRIGLAVRAGHARAARLRRPSSRGGRPRRRPVSTARRRSAASLVAGETRTRSLTSTYIGAESSVDTRATASRSVRQGRPGPAGARSTAASASPSSRARRGGGRTTIGSGSNLKHPERIAGGQATRAPP